MNGFNIFRSSMMQICNQSLSVEGKEKESQMNFDERSGFLSLARLIPGQRIDLRFYLETLRASISSRMGYYLM